MHDALTLAIDFLDEHPDAAVRILEQHDPGQVAAFLDTVPDSYCALVLERALPAFAARLCKELGNDNAARLLLQQNLGRMVAVLRNLEEAQVEEILQQCPRSRRHACLLLLRYPLQSTGAWIVPDTAVVPQDFTVNEVHAFLREAAEETFSKYVFVVDREGKPVGRVSYLVLLKARPEQKAGWVMEKPLDVISGSMLLEHAAMLPCWTDNDVMPVVGAQQQFIGVIRHADLRRGMQSGRRAEPAAVPDSDPFSGIFAVYGKSLLALFNTVSNAVETELKS